MVTPYPQFFQLNIYADDSKGTLVAGPISRVSPQRHRVLMAPADFSFDMQLTDHVTANITQGQYFELYAGLTVPQVLWCSGYIQTVTRTAGSQDAYSITAASYTIALSSFRDMGALNQPASSGVYTDILSRINGVPDSTGAVPPGHKGFLTGTGIQAVWIDPKGSKPPGMGEGYRSDWATAWDALLSVAQHYNFYVRDADSIQKSHNGTIEIGPFNDDSGCVIWGGKPLLDDYNNKHGSNLIEMSAGLAQADGYAVISNASYQEDLSHIINLVWPIGHGHPDKGGTTLRPLAGGDPTGQPSGTDANGWTFWQPYGGGTRVYYIKASSRVTYNGNTYEFVSTQRNDGKWAFGVIDRASVAKYGIHEYFLPEKKITNPDWLLSAAIGHVEYNADPVGQWTFTVKHPLTSDSGVPTIARPGQAMTVHYSGVVHDALELDTNPLSSTWGQMIGVGNFTYLDYPGVDPSDPKYQKLRRVIDVADSWTPDGFEVTYTLGRGKWKSHHWFDALAKHMEHNVHERHSHHTAFHKKPFEGIPFLFSSSPDAHEDEINGTISLNPGATVVSDVPDSTFFSDHHSVQFTADIEDSAAYLDFWFSKPTDRTLQSPNTSGQVYGIFRLAMPQSGMTSGLFTTTDGVIFTKRGSTPHKTKLANVNTGIWEVTVTWSGSTYSVHLANTDTDIHDGVQNPFVAAKWTDRKFGGVRVINAQGAIGWKAHGGSLPITLSSIHAHPVRRKHRAITGGNGKRLVHLHEPDYGDGAGGGGVEHRTVDDTTDSSTLTHLHGWRGKTHHLDEHSHGPFSPSSATVASVSVASGTYTVLLQGSIAHPITRGGLKGGWMIQCADLSGVVFQIQSVLYGADVSNPTSQSSDGQFVVGFITTDPNASVLTIGTSLHWDVLSQSSEPDTGHISRGVYVSYTDKNGAPAQGWAKAHMAADAFGNVANAFIVYPDGSTGVGAVPITDSSGKTGTPQDLAVGGAALALSLEQQGFVPFDSGEYNSSTQTGYTYSGTSGTRVLSVGPNTTGFLGGPVSTSVPLSWTTPIAQNPNTGASDAQLAALVAGTANTALWQDTQILNDAGIAKSFTIKHDISLRIPVYVATGVASTQSLGTHATLLSGTAAGSGLTFPIDSDPNAMMVLPGDTFIVNPGGSNQETVTISAFQTNTNANGTKALDIVSATHAHDSGELMLMALHQGTAVNSGGTLNGSTALGSTLPTGITCIAVGYWDGTSWYRGWWGDPAWKAPYLNDTGLPGYATSNNMNYLGPVAVGANQWFDLHCKASELGLYSQGLQPVAVSGVELAIYGASAGAGATVYFDAHEHGDTSGASQLPGGSILSNHIDSGAITNVHKDPTSNADGHWHDNLLFWCDSAKKLHWTTGSFTMADGSTLSINGGTQTSPNTGLLATLGSVTSPGGNFVVFNTTGSPMTIRETIGGLSSVIIPAYSVSGGTGGQGTGFGFLDAGFDWTAKPGGGTTKHGAPKGLLKVAKIGINIDPQTGDYPVQTYHGSGAVLGPDIRNATITGNNIASATIIANNIQDAAITANKIQDASIQAQKIVDGTITAVKILNGTITATQIHSGTITANEIFNGTITATQIHSGTITSNEILNGTIKGTNIDSATVMAGNIGNLTILAGNIANLTITRDKSHPHVPSKFLIKNAIFVIAAGVGPVTMSWASGGYVILSDGTTYNILNTSCSINAGDYLMFNSNQSASVLYADGGTHAAGSIFATTYAPRPVFDDDFFMIGRISNVRDARSGAYWIHGHHHGVHQTVGVLIGNKVVGTNHLLDTGTGAAAATSGWDFSTIPTYDIYLIKRNWLNTAPTAPGSLSNGNLTGFSQWGTNMMLEAQVWGQDGVAGVWIDGSYPGGWQRFPIFATAKGAFNGYNIGNVPDGFQIITTDKQTVFVIGRFEILPDGTANVYYGYCSTLTSGNQVAIRFRIVYSPAA